MRSVNYMAEKKKAVMEACFNCYCETGLAGTGMKALAQACNMSPGNLYSYFNDLDDLIIQSTAYCMTKVEEDLMKKAPATPRDVMRFLREIPYWLKDTHGKKFRLMYQIYTHPKYIEEGKKFFEGANDRYLAYASELEERLGIPKEELASMLYIFVHTCVHFAMFENEEYLKAQLNVIEKGFKLFLADSNQ